MNTERQIALEKSNKAWYKLGKNLSELSAEIKEGTTTLKEFGERLGELNKSLKERGARLKMINGVYILDKNISSNES